MVFACLWMIAWHRQPLILVAATGSFGMRNLNVKRLAICLQRCFTISSNHLADAAKCNLNIKAEGDNEHHKIEAIFKAFAKAIKMAIKRDAEKMVLPSTKGRIVSELGLKSCE